MIDVQTELSDLPATSMELIRRAVEAALFSEHATSVELLLFDGPDATQPARVIALDVDTPTMPLHDAIRER